LKNTVIEAFKVFNQHDCLNLVGEMSKSQKERVKNSFIENRPVDLASPTSSSPHSIPSTHPQSSSSHSSHPPTSPKHLPSPPHSPHHKTSPHNVPSPLTLPEADVEQEKGLDMPDEILAVVNEITWKNHVSEIFLNNQTNSSQNNHTNSSTFVIPRVGDGLTLQVYYTLTEVNYPLLSSIDFSSVQTIYATTENCGQHCL